ncbi:hypothetical protein FNYG_14240 [Fusarium nygamai]|uniref:Uncharacterized protein n=1 Tax=Gibberella nygamai TaxID=42673 RepID=A0A2K0UTQ8_GIBNY|nr:hypothetical protein FNYG_14240 [Fusarium nygamai]
MRPFQPTGRTVGLNLEVGKGKPKPLVPPVEGLQDTSSVYPKVEGGLLHCGPFDALRAGHCVDGVLNHVFITGLEETASQVLAHFLNHLGPAFAVGQLFNIDIWQE